MKKQNSRNIIFLMLLAFCGQVLAAPFLDCCDEMQIMSEDGDMVLHHNLEMNMSVEMQHMDFDVEHNHADMFGDDANHACGFDCNFCSATTLPLTEELGTQQILSSSKFSIYNFILPSTKTDTPFKPPIAA
jgi:hypothetical protein